MVTEQLIISEAPVSLTINWNPAKYMCLVADSRKWLVEYVKGCLTSSLSGKGLQLTMPCGAQKVYASADDLPQHSERCTCGNPDHWFVYYKDDQEDKKND